MPENTDAESRMGEQMNRRELREQILHQMDGRTSYVSDKDVYREIDKAILRSSHGGYGTLSEKEELRRQMFYSIRGFDVLEKYLGDSSISEIMVIGAGDGGVVRELTRYDRVRHIDLVEMDPMVVEACRAYLPGNACRLDDRRVHLHYENALRFIRRCEAKYDLIIVDSSDPFGPSEGLFTREFYGNCYNALKDDGIMVNQQGSPFYAEDAHAMQRSHKRIASTFQISRVYQAHIPTFAAGYWLFGFASKKYHPVDDLDAEAWNALNLRTRYYTTRLHKGAFYLPAFLEDMLKEVED